MKAKTPRRFRFTSDRLRLLEPLINPQVINLALRRIEHDRERITAKHRGARIALILIREINPDQYLTDAEQGILRGMDRKTFGKLQRQGDL